MGRELNRHAFHTDLEFVSSPHTLIYSPIHPQAPSGYISRYGQFKFEMPTPLYTPPFQVVLPFIPLFTIGMESLEGADQEKRGLGGLALEKPIDNRSYCVVAEHKGFLLGCGHQSWLDSKLESAAKLTLLSLFVEIP